MASLLKLCSAVLVLFFLFQQGLGARCSLADIVITQGKTGNMVEGKPEYEVTLTNRCKCAQSRVVVRCYGLSSVKPVDPRAIKPVDGVNCVVNGGRPVLGGAAVKFKYAWITPQDFLLVRSMTSC